MAGCTTGLASTAIAFGPPLVCELGKTAAYERCDEELSTLTLTKLTPLVKIPYANKPCGLRPSLPRRPRAARSFFNRDWRGKETLVFDTAFCFIQEESRISLLNQIRATGCSEIWIDRRTESRQ